MAEVFNDAYRFDHLTKPGDLARALIAEAKRGSTDTGICLHCGGAIFYAPFFLDGKLPNPPVWQHDSGGRTCSTKPKGWRKQSWPFAEPVVPKTNYPPNEGARE